MKILRTIYYLLMAIFIIGLASELFAQQPETFTFNAVITDMDNDALVIDWRVEPAGPVIESGQGTDTVDITFDEEGVFQVCVTVYDGIWPVVESCRGVPVQINSPPTIDDLNGPDVIPLLPVGFVLNGPRVIQAECTDADSSVDYLQFRVNGAFVGSQISEQLSTIYEYDYDPSGLPPDTPVSIGAVCCDIWNNCINAPPVRGSYQPAT